MKCWWCREERGVSDPPEMAYDESTDKWHCPECKLSSPTAHMLNHQASQQ
jgi:hypothetical protein